MMFGDIKRIEAMLKQMGIKAKPIEAKRVIIETEEYDLVLESPEVVEINAKGEVSFSIVPKGGLEKREKLNEEDISLVMEKANVSREKAIEALKKVNGDVTEAILLLSGE